MSTIKINRQIAQVKSLKDQAINEMVISQKDYHQVQRLENIVRGLKELEQELAENIITPQINLEEIVLIQKRLNKSCPGITLHINFVRNAKRENFVVYPINLARCQKNI